MKTTVRFFIAIILALSCALGVLAGTERATFHGTVTVGQGGTGLTSTSQNFLFIGPTSGSGAPTFRTLVTADALIGTSAYYGDGSDGSVTFDGSTTILGMAPAANVYTMTRDIYVINMTVNTGVTVKNADFIIQGTGTLTINGTGKINGDGAAGSGVLGGTGIVAKTLGHGASGGGGVSNAAGGAGSTVTGGAGGVGGTGGTSHAGTTAGGAGGTTTPPTALEGTVHSINALRGIGSGSALKLLQGGSGGGAGGGGSATAGAGGGAGGNWVVVAFRVISNAGTISADGGAGANGGGSGTSGTGSGAGGGGGVVVYMCDSLTNTGTISANGGAAGVNASEGTPTAAAAGVVVALLNNR